MTQEVLSDERVAQLIREQDDVQRWRDIYSRRYDEISRMLVNSGEAKLRKASEQCPHDKPSDGHCCFVTCPNFAGKFR